MICSVYGFNLDSKILGKILCEVTKVVSLYNYYNLFVIFF